MIHDLLARLEKVKQTGRQRYIAQCPCHQDSTPSLAVTETDDGRILMLCRAGCDTLNILESIGMDFNDLFPDGQLNKDHKPINRGKPSFSAYQLLALMRVEAIVLSIAAEKLIQGKALDDDEIGRFRQAKDNIYQASRQT
jgi:hypothetical protein